jgi:hypothetical protein
MNVIINSLRTLFATPTALISQIRSLAFGNFNFFFDNIQLFQSYMTFQL